MPTKKKQTKGRSQKLAWRKGKKHWTDTLFPKKLLRNPYLMTNHELVSALTEHMLWRKGTEKYHWYQDPIEEDAETEPPFSAEVISNMMYEVLARLSMIEDIVNGRLFKNDVRI